MVPLPSLVSCDQSAAGAFIKILFNVSIARGLGLEACLWVFTYRGMITLFMSPYKIGLTSEHSKHFLTVHVNILTWASVIIRYIEM